MKTLQLKISSYVILIVTLCIIAFFANTKFASAEDIDDYGAAGWWMMNSEFVGYDYDTCGAESGVIQISLAEHDSETLLASNIPTWKVEVIEFDGDGNPVVLDEWTSTSSTQNTSGKLCFLGNSNYIGVSVLENDTYYELTPVYQNAENRPDSNFYGEFYKGTAHLLEKSVPEKDLYPVQPFFAETTVSPAYLLSTTRIPEDLYNATSLSKSKLYIQDDSFTIYSAKRPNNGSVEPALFTPVPLSDGRYWWRFFNAFNGTVDFSNGTSIFDSPVSSVTKPAPFTLDTTPPVGGVTITADEPVGALINADFNITVQDATIGTDKVTFYLKEIIDETETESSIVFDLDGTTNIYERIVDDAILAIGPTYEYYIVAVDELGNTLTTETQTFVITDPTPDLTVEAIEPYTDSPYTQPTDILFKAKVSNRVGAVIDGTEYQAGWATVDIDWNSDGSYDTYYVPDAATSLGTFTSGEHKYIYYTFTNPPAGTHKYRFNVDVAGSPQGLLAELDETNNTTEWKSFEVTYKPIVKLDASTDKIILGDDLTLTWYTIGDTVSCDTSPWSSQTGISGSEVISGLGLGEQSFSISCVGPGGTGVATAYINVVEAPEGPPPATADLTASPVVVDTPVASTSAVLTFSTGEITNVGTADAGAHNIGGFYIDSNDDGMADYTVLLPRVNATTSADGGTYSTSTTWDAGAAGATVGTYRVSYIVDVDNEIVEGGPNGESNNFSGWTTFELADSGSLTFTTPNDTIDEGENIVLDWSTNGMLTCVASGDWTGEQDSSQGNHGKTLYDVDPGSYTFKLTCMDVANVIHDEEVNVDVVIPADLIPTATPFLFIPSSEIDPETGAYNNLSMKYIVKNTGDFDVDVNTKVKFIVTYSGYTLPATDAIIPPLAAGASSNTYTQILATNVPADTLIEVEMIVDADDDVDEGTRGGEGNNTAEDSVTLTYLDPGLSLESTPMSALVAYESYLDLSWNINGSMYMEKCLLFGKGLPSDGESVYDIHASDGEGDLADTDIITDTVEFETSGTVDSVGPITNTTKYWLECTALDGSIFEKSIWIDTVGKIEEI